MFKRKDGLWQEKLRINGKDKYFYAKTRSELLKKIQNHKEKEDRGELFETVADEWWDRHSPTLAANTLRSYRPAYNRAKETFSGQYIKYITYRDIQKYLDSMKKKYPSLKVKQTQRLVFNGIFKYARKMGYIEVIQTDGLECSGTKTKRGTPSTQCIDAIKKGINCTFGLFPLAILYTGLRRGEALALDYEDIDRKNNLIYVSKSVYYINNKPYIKEPKTEAGKRAVPLLAPLKAVLPKHKSGHLFSDEDGNLLKEYQVEDLLIKYRRETQTSFTPHQLRHAYATILHENGISAKDAQEILGHAQISTTLDIYTEFRENRAAELSAKLNKVIK